MSDDFPPVRDGSPPPVCRNAPTTKYAPVHVKKISAKRPAGGEQGGRPAKAAKFVESYSPHASVSPIRGANTPLRRLAPSKHTPVRRPQQTKAGKKPADFNEEERDALIDALVDKGRRYEDIRKKYIALTQYSAAELDGLYHHLLADPDSGLIRKFVNGREVYRWESESEDSAMDE